MCSTSPSAVRCSTIWQTQAVQAWCRAMGLTLIHFDECELGQAAVKSTVLATDLPLHHWQGLHCTHEKHERAPGMNSSDLSRYPRDDARPQHSHYGRSSIHHTSFQVTSLVGPNSALASKSAHYVMEEENQVRVGLHHPYESQPPHSWTWGRKSFNSPPMLWTR